MGSLESDLILMEDDAGVAYPNNVAVSQHLAAYFVTVHRSAVGRTEVVGGCGVAVELNVQVPPRNSLVEQLQIGVGAAADDVAAGA